MRWLRSLTITRAHSSRTGRMLSCVTTLLVAHALHAPWAPAHLHMAHNLPDHAHARPSCCRKLEPVSDDLILRVESGDRGVLASHFPSALLVASGRDLFKLIEENVARAAQLSGTAKALTSKTLPDSIEYFGWCTWDAFYSSVSAAVRREQLQSMYCGGGACHCTAPSRIRHRWCPDLLALHDFAALWVRASRC
jgi:Raffinose synthase or seed imbibition protein Sip1